MKETKYFHARSSSRWSLGWLLRSSKRRVWNNLRYNVGLIILAGVSALIIMFRRENAVVMTGMTETLHRMMFPTKFEMQQQLWNYSSWSFEPNVSDWDDQRARWLKEHKDVWSEQGARSRVMMVTGSSPDACETSILSHLLLRSGKNKLDYCRMHDMDLYYNMGNPDPDFSDWWVKLPVIRMLMLQHPRLEWIWWLDADAILTDMSFEPPFAELEYHNLVLYGDDQLVYHLRDWESASTSNFMIRNCQWSLDLLDAWGSMGTAKMRDESGKFESEVLANRPPDFPGDDQSSLVALLAQDQRNPLAEQKWVPSVKLVKETEYVMNGNWAIVGPELENLGLDNLQRVPFVTHFRGCLPACTGEPDELSTERLDLCREQLEHAFDFADNQVYRQYGFQPRTLGRSLEPLSKTSSAEFATEDNTEGVRTGEEYSLNPKVTDWDERRQVWMDEHPSTKREEVLLVSGSAPKPCVSKGGGHFLLWGFKNRIDYARINGVSKIFYNMAVIDKGLTGWWSKLPLLKMLMLSNPNIEWIWWMDSDAAFTDMEFKLPFSRYNAEGYNLVMYGSEHEVFDKKSYTGINTGNLLIRNCQWSLDLLDRWASFGATEELRWKNEDLLNNFLSDRPSGWSADDQCVLVYVLITEREKWDSQVCFETSFAMSGHWEYWVTLFVDGVELEFTPFVTHFAGCHPCKVVAQEKCMVGIERTYNFADNQVLELYGLRHENLNSSELLKTSQFISDLHVEHVDGIEDLEAEEELEEAMEEVVQPANVEHVDGIEDLEAKEELEEAMEEVVQPAKAEILEEKLAETKDDLDTTNEGDVGIGSTKELDTEPTEFDDTSKDNQLDSAPIEEKPDGASKEDESEIVSKEESEVASKEEALNKALDEEASDPDSKDVESEPSVTDEDLSKAYKEEEVDTASHGESETTSKEEWDAASKEEALNKALDEEAFDPDSKDVESEPSVTDEYLSKAYKEEEVDTASQGESETTSKDAESDAASKEQALNKALDEDAFDLDSKEVESEPSVTDEDLSKAYKEEEVDTVSQGESETTSKEEWDAASKEEALNKALDEEVFYPDSKDADLGTSNTQEELNKANNEKKSDTFSKAEALQTTEKEDELHPASKNESESESDITYEK